MDNYFLVFLVIFAALLLHAQTKTKSSLRRIERENERDFKKEMAIKQELREFDAWRLSVEESNRNGRSAPGRPEFLYIDELTSSQPEER